MRLSIIRMMPPLLAVDWQITFLSPPFYSAGNNRIPPPVPPESHVILPKILHPTPPLPSSGW